MRKLILLAVSVITSPAFADSCPSAHELQSNHASRWKAYDSDDGQPLSAARTLKLQHSIAHFAMAEWSHSHNKNTIHCYYNNAHGSAMEAYFAKDSASPVKSSKYWYAVTGMMQCAAGADKCQFQSLPGAQQQFASNDPIDSAG
jgi:hypothetical protein